MHFIHDLPAFTDSSQQAINVVIDVPKGSNNKYEYDHDLWCFRLDRVIHHSMYYPCDYGFIPQTLCGDGDPLDVCLITTNPTFTWCVIKARIIGILYTKDNAGDDPKIIAVPTDEVDPRRSEVHHIDALGHHMKEELLLLFKEIKILEHDKYEKIEVKGFGSVLEAQQEVLSSTQNYLNSPLHNQWQITSDK